MDVDHIVMLKARLEVDALKLFKDFEQVTGMEVAGVTLDTIKVIGRRAEIVKVHIIAQLPE